MCFSNDDCDWYASIQTETRSRSNKLRRCRECGDDIEIGDWFTDVFQQERETCETCEQNEDDDELTAEEKEHDCDFGETYRCCFCENCRLIRHAIYLVETEEECPEWARQPGYGAMADELSQHSSVDAYLERALELYPETSSSPLMRYLSNE